MPAAMGYTPNDPKIREAANTELKVRQDGYAHAQKYYAGQHPRQLKTEPGEVDDNTVINFVQQITDRVAAFLFPEMPDLELDDGSEDDEEFLETAWQEAGGATLMARAARAGCLAGHVFMRVMPPTLPGDSPRIILLNPANVIVFWQADDPDTALWYEVHYKAGEMEYRQDVISNAATGDAGDAWLILTYCKDGSEWKLQQNLQWNLPIPPIVDWPHVPALPGTYYGGGELGNFKLNDRINKVSSDIARILRFYSAPKTVAIGIKGDAVIATGIDNLWTIDNPAARVENLEMQSDLQSSMGFLDYLTQSFLAERRVVVLKGDVADMQRVTNLGLRALYIDQIAKTEELRRTYGRGIRRISQLLLAVANKIWQGRGIREIWADPLPVSELETMQVVQGELSLGIISKESASKRMGLDWDLEQMRMAEEETEIPSSAEMGASAAGDEQMGQASQAPTDQPHMEMNDAAQK